MHSACSENKKLYQRRRHLNRKSVVLNHINQRDRESSHLFLLKNSCFEKLPKQFFTHALRQRRKIISRRMNKATGSSYSPSARPNWTGDRWSAWYRSCAPAAWQSARASLSPTSGNCVRAGSLATSRGSLRAPVSPSGRLSRCWTDAAGAGKEKVAHAVTMSRGCVLTVWDDVRVRVTWFGKETTKGT